MYQIYALWCVCGPMEWNDRRQDGRSIPQSFWLFDKKEVHVPNICPLVCVPTDGMEWQTPGWLLYALIFLVGG